MHRPVVDFPEPDSPTSPSVLPGRDVEADAVDRVDVSTRPLDEEPALDREALDEVAHLEERLARSAHVATPDGRGGALARRMLRRGQCPGRISRSSGIRSAQPSALAGVRAARREAAADGRVDEVGRPARDRGQPRVRDGGVLELRQRAEQRLGVGVLGPVEELA